jgi:hypothetical protein
MIGRKMDNAAKELGRKIISELEKIVHALTHTPRQQDEAGISPQHQPYGEGDTTQGQPALKSHIPAAPPYSEKPEKPWYKTLSGWKSIAELIAIPFAIGYAVVTYFQWKDLRHNFEVDQRALVKITFGIPTTVPTIGAMDAVPVTVLNIGKSPALRARVDASLEIVEHSNPPTFSFRKSHLVIDVGMLFPNDPMKPILVSTTFPRNLRPIQLTVPEIQDLIEGKTYIAAYAIAEYSDQFGRHWTRFCDWKSYTAKTMGANADPCVKWSAIGDGEPPH